MLRLSSRERVPLGPRGESLVAPCFALRKDDACDRAIVNRRRRNATESAQDGVTPTFPLGTCLCDVEIQRGEVGRVSLDDLPDYYHWIGVGEERARSNAVGPTLPVSVARDLACWRRLSEEERRECLADGCAQPLWGVLPMGDLNAVGYAQEAHANLLRRGGCLRDHELIVHRRPWPAGATAEGLMVDDHAVVQVVPAGEDAAAATARVGALVDGAAECTARFDDELLLARSLRAYARSGLAPKASKSVRFAPRADFWGASFDGERGVARAKLDVLWRAVLTSVNVLQLGATTLGLWRVLLGLWAHVLAYCREGFAFFDAVYKFLDAFGSAAREGTVRSLPARVRDELSYAIAFAPLLERDLRAGYSAQMSFTDASSAWGAAVETDVEPGVARAFWRHRIQRRGYLRVGDEWEDLEEHAETHGDEFAAEALAGARRLVGEPSRAERRSRARPSAPWLEEYAEYARGREVLRYRLDSAEHIDVKEARALSAEERRVSTHVSEHGSRRMFVLDALVVAGAGAKGRSSSSRMNRPFRLSAPSKLLCGLRCGYAHVRSAFNPADDPTRGRRVRVPWRASLPWLADVREDPAGGLARSFPQVALKTPAGLCDAAGRFPSARGYPRTWPFSARHAGPR